MRREDEFVTDIVRHGRLVLDLVDDLDETTSSSDSETASIPSGPRSPSRSSRSARPAGGLSGAEMAAGPPPAAIVAAHPEIDWRGWIGLRNVLTHGYHRRDPPVIWRAMGEVKALVRACEAWTQPET